jgi:hypothetical protein
MMWGDECSEFAQWYYPSVTWNYRILKEHQKNGSWTYGIYEVYYDEDTGAPFAFAEEPELSGDSVQDIQEELEYMRKALKTKPINKNALRRQLQPLADIKKEGMVPWEEVKKELGLTL